MTITLHAMEVSEDVPPPPPSPEETIKHEKQKQRKSLKKDLESIHSRINDMDEELSRKIEKAIREARMEGFQEAQAVEKLKYEQQKEREHAEHIKQKDDELSKKMAGIDLAAKALSLALNSENKKKKKKWFRKSHDVERI